MTMQKENTSGQTTARRLRKPKVKPGELRVYWGRCERYDAPSLVYYAGGGGADRRDGRVLSEAFEGKLPMFESTLAKELDARGYDLTTIQFSIRVKDQIP